jgi:hypothetical protein
MKISSALPAAVLIGLIAAPVSAAEGDACLQNNRIWSWQMINDRTLVVTDVNHKPFTVRTTGPCTGLTNVLNDVAFKSTLSLGCLQPGGQIVYRAPGLGRLSCFINEVKPGAPEKQPDKDHAN